MGMHACVCQKLYWTLQHLCTCMHTSCIKATGDFWSRWYDMGIQEYWLGHVLEAVIIFLLTIPVPANIHWIILIGVFGLQDHERNSYPHWAFAASTALCSFPRSLFRWSANGFASTKMASRTGWLLGMMWCDQGCGRELADGGGIPVPKQKTNTEKIKHIWN